MLNCMATFPGERNVFYREKADATYPTLSFFLSYTLAEIPFEIVCALLFQLVTGVAVGLQSSPDHYFVFVFIVFCILFCGESIAISFLALVYNPGISVAISNLVLTLFTLMAGVFSLGLEAVLDGINRISVLRYTTRVAFQYELTGLQFYCTSSQLLADGSCPFTNGDQVLALYQFDDAPVWQNMLIVAFLTVAYRVVSFLILHVSSRKHRYLQ